MRAHVRLNKGCAAYIDHPRYSIFEVRRTPDILDERTGRHWSTVDNPHNDNAVVGEICGISESDCRTHVRNNCVAEVRGRSRIMPDEFEAGIIITQHDNLAGEGYKRDVVMWAEAAFTCYCDLSIGLGDERSCDLGAGGVELRARPFDIPAEGSEPISIDAIAHANAQTERAIQQRRDYLLFAMHCREHRQFALIWSGYQGHCLEIPLALLLFERAAVLIVADPALTLGPRGRQRFANHGGEVSRL